MITIESRRTTPYIGNGTVTVYPFNFKVFVNTDLQLLTYDTAGNVEELVIGTDYSVSLNGNQETNPGGNVTLTVALPVGKNLVIKSDLPYTQDTNLANPGGFYPTVLNNSLDKAVILIQQLKDSQDNQDAADTNLVLPQEKRNIAYAWAVIQSEYASQLAAGNTVPVSGTTFAQAFNELSAFIIPLLVDMTVTSVISRTTYNTLLSNYYIQRATHMALIITTMVPRLNP